jgi:nucleoside-diphosphate-sugar epimerase
VKVLVTGAAGEFGRDLVPWLARKHDVRATDIAPATVPCEFVQADLRDPEALGALVDGVDAVIHLAVLLPMPHPTAAFVDVNVKATTLLCEAAARARVGRFVYISTVWATGHGTEEGCLPVDEEAPLRPQEMYGLTKLQGELSAEFYARMHGLSTLVLRMCGYVRCSQFSPDGSVDLATANLGEIAACLLRPGQKVCTPNDLGNLMDAAISRDIGNFRRVIAGNAVPWHPGDIEQLGTDPLPVIERYYPGAKALFEAFGVTPAPVDAYYSVARCRELLEIQQEYTVADLVR